MKYENDDQIIEDAAKEIIKVHLNFSNSLDYKPSDNPRGFVKCDIYAALIDYYGDKAGGWNNVGNEDRDKIARKTQAVFDAASIIADGKWVEAMNILGI